MSDTGSEFHLKLNADQARVVSKALDLYARLAIGQLGMVHELVRDGVIPSFAEGKSKIATPLETMERVRELMDAVKQELGFPRNGSFGIFNSLVDVSGKRAYEVHKALAQAIATDREPEPDFRTVDYDGVTVRSTSDPLPTVEVVRPAPGLSGP